MLASSVEPYDAIPNTYFPISIIIQYLEHQSADYVEPSLDTF